MRTGRQRPGTAKGFVFLTLEDETGIANVIVWPKVFERFRPVVLGARLIGVTGKLQNESGVIHIVAESCEDLTPLLRRLSADASTVDATGPTDEGKRPDNNARLWSHPRRAFHTLTDDERAPADDVAAASARAAMPKGRNFH